MNEIQVVCVYDTYLVTTISQDKNRGRFFHLVYTCVMKREIVLLFLTDAKGLFEGIRGNEPKSLLAKHSLILTMNTFQT